MKITETRVIERKLIMLFNDSKNNVNKEKNIEAQTVIKKIIEVFDLISVFNNVSHTTIVKKLYFNKNNIMVKGTRIIARELFMDEKTLYRLRLKYCMVIKEILTF